MGWGGRGAEEKNGGGGGGGERERKRNSWDIILGPELEG